MYFFTKDVLFMFRFGFGLFVWGFDDDDKLFPILPLFPLLPLFIPIILLLLFCIFLLPIYCYCFSCFISRCYIDGCILLLLVNISIIINI